MEREAPEPIELILYVAANSPKADAAVTKMRAVVDEFTSPRVTLTVRLLPGADGVASEAPPRVAIRQNGTVRTMIVGHITTPELLLELLADCDLDL